jgi:periplasmic divalent cation tolerance protein
MLVKKSLAGCCQIVGPIESHYIWENRAEVSKEYLCLIKTTTKHYKRIEKTIKDYHTYQVPEIIAVDIEKGYRPYFKWLNKSLR